MSGHAIGIHEHLDYPRPPADDVGPRHVAHRCQSLRDLLGHAPQRHVVGRPAGQREGHHRHVVDLDRLDHPAGDAGRDDVQVLVDLLVELDEAPLAVLADVVADRDDRLILAAHRVDVLHAVDLIEQLFQRRGDQLLDFRRGVAGEVHVDVGQRHDDLRILFPRREAQRRQADHCG